MVLVARTGRDLYPCGELNPLAVVTERATASARDTVIALDVVTFRALVVVVIDSRARKARVKRSDFHTRREVYRLVIARY